jgi:hypothetical protein
MNYVEKNPLTNNWELINNNPKLPAEVIHILQYPPEKKEIYDTFIIFEQITNYPALILCYGIDENDAITAAEDCNLISRNSNISIKQVNVKFN